MGRNWMKYKKYDDGNKQYIHQSDLHINMSILTCLVFVFRVLIFYNTKYGLKYHILWQPYWISRWRPIRIIHHFNSLCVHPWKRHAPHCFGCACNTMEYFVQNCERNTLGYEQVCERNAQRVKKFSGKTLWHHKHL